MRAYYDELGHVTLTHNSIILDLPYIEIENCNFIKPKVNLETFKIFESASSDVIANSFNQIKLLELQQFMQNKRLDGELYYEEIEMSLTIVLTGLSLVNELIEINQEITQKIRPIINEIRNGDWFNAYMKLEINNEYERPTHLFLGQTFDQIKQKVKNYFETNYPRE